jgi:hypothetical protein
MAQATNEKVYLFRELVRAVLDPAIADPHLRRPIDQRIPLAVLRRAAEESDRIVRPLDDSYVGFFETRDGYLRQCTPAFLATVTFHATQHPPPPAGGRDRVAAARHHPSTHGAPRRPRQTSSP